MEYTINKLAKISGVSSRTLRYYDEIGLLYPTRISSNGYRIYGQDKVDTLQQILFYRELGIALHDIGRIMSAPDYDRETALAGHLSALLQKKAQIDLLICNVQKTIDTFKGKRVMNDNEKFKGFKQKMIDDNEATYGEEIRAKYGDSVVNDCNQKFNGMDEAQWSRSENLRAECENKLKLAFDAGSPASETAQLACDLHRQWICMFWKEGMYSKEYHKGLADMYVSDERFAEYYNKFGSNCAQFLRDAIYIYCS